MNFEATVHQLVDHGELSIDESGRVWRVAARRGLKLGGSHLIPCAPRRAENRTSLGYLQVRALIDGRRYHALAHRLVWHHMHGTIPDGLTVNHLNGDKSCNTPDNLELATPAEQTAHAYATGLRVDQRDANGRFAAKEPA